VSRSDGPGEPRAFATPAALPPPRQVHFVIRISASHSRASGPRAVLRVLNPEASNAPWEEGPTAAMVKPVDCALSRQRPPPARAVFHSEGVTHYVSDVIVGVMYQVADPSSGSPGSTGVASGRYRVMARRMRGAQDGQARQTFRDLIDVPA